MQYAPGLDKLAEVVFVLYSFSSGGKKISQTQKNKFYLLPRIASDFILFHILYKLKS